MEQHFKVIGWIFLILGVLVVLGCLFWLAVIPKTMSQAMEQAAAMQRTTPPAGYPMPGQPAQLPPGVPTPEAAAKLGVGIASGMIIVVLIFSAVGAITGLGLVTRKGWARVLTIIVSILSLAFVGPGTALGIYGLWAMFSGNSADAWRAYTSA